LRHEGLLLGHNLLLGYERLLLRELRSCGDGRLRNRSKRGRAARCGTHGAWGEPTSGWSKVTSAWRKPSPRNHWRCNHWRGSRWNGNWRCNHRGGSNNCRGDSSSSRNDSRGFRRRLFVSANNLRERKPLVHSVGPDQGLFRDGASLIGGVELLQGHRLDVVGTNRNLPDLFGGQLGVGVFGHWILSLLVVRRRLD
jgi:hypothetical protein